MLCKVAYVEEKATEIFVHGTIPAEAASSGSAFGVRYGMDDNQENHRNQTITTMYYISTHFLLHPSVLFLSIIHARLLVDQQHRILSQQSAQLLQTILHFRYS